MDHQLDEKCSDIFIDIIHITVFLLNAFVVKSFDLWRIFTIGVVTELINTFEFQLTVRTILAELSTSHHIQFLISKRCVIQPFYPPNFKESTYQRDSKAFFSTVINKRLTQIFDEWCVCHSLDFAVIVYINL